MDLSMINFPFIMGHGHDKKSIAELRLGMDNGSGKEVCRYIKIWPRSGAGGGAGAHLTSPRPR